MTAATIALAACGIRMTGKGPRKVYIPGTAKAFNDGAIASMQKINQPQPLKRRLNRRIEPRIDPRRAIAVRPVPSIDLSQFGGKFVRRPGILQGRVALTIVENQQPDRVGPYPEI